MSTKKKSATNIIKPLAAAFLTAEPEEEVAVPAKPQSKKPAPRPVVKPAEVKIGELTKEETRALLKEQLVAGVVDDKPDTAEEEIPFKEEPAVKKTADKKEIKKEVKKDAEKKADKKAETKAGLKEADKKAPDNKAADKKNAENKNTGSKVSGKKAGDTVTGKEKKPAEKAGSSDTKKEAGPKEELNIEYGGSTYSKDELINKALKVWTSVLKRGRSELHNMELYVKPQEKKVYYVFNGKRKGSFEI